VLRDISLEIKPGSRVGICGRTGRYLCHQFWGPGFLNGPLTAFSGKSTLILTILRLAEIQVGDILIDGISIKTTPRHRVRRGITAMPQEPLLLPGTIRSNLDPFSEHLDQAILSALDEVGIFDVISAGGGLNANMDNILLSRGQQQLFCLTRAILSKSQIVLLDEMTSSVDAATEAKIVEVIHRRLSDRTVVAVAHHLHTIRGFDKIVVLDQGQVIECDSPKELLKKSSVFRELWERR
jgi:ATP-binding cassette, subfamily C (CFTR/MRP), member 1